VPGIGPFNVVSDLQAVLIFLDPLHLEAQVIEQPLHLIIVNDVHEKYAHKKLFSDPLCRIYGSSKYRIS
jgi:hypothetical protein